MKLPITVSNHNKEPIYYQIESQIKAMIASGQLSPGTVLPSIRSLSQDLSCSLITTRRAYQNLERDGYIQTVQGKGTFVLQLENHVQKEFNDEKIYQSFLKNITEAQLAGYSKEQIHSIYNKVIDEIWKE
ncbi:GntR family transcriptional regulator [Gracilibacillus marinus]|jgi:GntR family transcriptional regulator|uniref:GntR family transcriptional regulator n=1 Tax=Gracilibacillus marinus TaxID=630535 RepID=A0ABV8W001_9BACI